MPKDKKNKETKVKRSIDVQHVAMRFVLVSILFTTALVALDAQASDAWISAKTLLTLPQALFAGYLLIKK